MNFIIKPNDIMTRFINLTFVFLFSTQLVSFGQDNLYDCGNSKNFAMYLYNTGQYELTRHELERIKFFCDFDTTSQLTLLKTYRKLNLVTIEQDFFGTPGVEKLDNFSPDFRDEYIRMLMTKQEYNQVEKLIDQGFSFSQIPEHQLGVELLMKNWEKAYQLSLLDNPNSNFKLAGLASIAKKSISAKRKSPVLAALLSAIIPGAGKAYCGYWGDAAISFMFTASTAFFTVRAFTNYDESKNVYPWIIGGLAASYYTANIYGGATSANRYNDNLDHFFIHETEKVLYSDY